MKNPIRRILLLSTLIAVGCVPAASPLRAQTFGQWDGSTYASLNAAITAIGTGTQATLVEWTTMPVTASVTVPSNITLKFVSPGQLTINGSTTVTINGPVQAPLTQIFAGTNTTNPVVFGISSVPGVYPQWWGAKGNATNNDTSAILMATTAMSRVFFPSGIYMVDPLIITASNVSWEGHGGAPSDSGVPTAAAVLRSRASQSDVLKLSGADCTFDFMTFDGNSSSSSVVHLVPSGANVTGNVFRRCTVEHATPSSGTLVNLDGSSGNSIVSNHFVECRIAQDYPNATSYCGTCVNVAGQSTSSNTFEKCVVLYGNTLVNFASGGGSFLNCQMQYWNTSTGYGFYVSGLGNPIEIAGCYTESMTNAMWFSMVVPTAWSNSPITLRNNMLNDSNLNIQLYPACPIQLFNNGFSGYVNISDPGIRPVSPVLSMGNCFPQGVDFGPTGGALTNYRNEISTSLCPIGGTQSAQMRTQLAQLAVGGQTPLTLHLSTTSNLNFGAPSSVPGSSLATISLPGAVVGDEVTVSASIATPANCILTGYVSAANTVTIAWTQIKGTAADPDGSGATYRASIWRH